MRFRWHPQARLVDAAGLGHGPGCPASVPLVLPSTPVAASLQAALGAPTFRIGGAGPAPAGEGVFETLTGGSSGTPRRIRRSQQSWIASFAVNAGLFDIGSGCRVAILGDLVHSLALYGAVEALHLGAELHSLTGLRPDRQARALAARRVAVLYATPAQLRALIEALIEAGQDWPDLRHVVIGGARLDAGLRQALSQCSDARAHEFYGAAETSFIALSDASAPEGSLGRPYPGAEIRSDPDGRLWVRSPYLAEGYAGPPGAALWRDGWVSPGEAGRLEGGVLWLEGRIGRQVKIADQTVQPEEIEAALLAWPGIRTAAVIARPDARRGAVLVACYQGAVDEAALLSALRRRFGSLKAPRRLYLWADGAGDWPVLPSGKTDFARLEAALAVAEA